jgi:hypothetical protein
VLAGEVTYDLRCFWDVTGRRVVIAYQRLGKAFFSSSTVDP